MRRTKHSPRPAEMAWVADGPQLGSPDKEVFSIGDLAREFGTTLRALRFYEQKGLLTPHHAGGTRRYGSRDRERLALVLKGKRLGFTLGEIAGMIEASEHAGPGTLDLSRQKCLDQIKLLERQKREIEAAIAELREIYSSFYLNAPKVTSE